MTADRSGRQARNDGLHRLEDAIQLEDETSATWSRRCINTIKPRLILRTHQRVEAGSTKDFVRKFDELGVAYFTSRVDLETEYDTPLDRLANRLPWVSRSRHDRRYERYQHRS